MMLPKKTAPLVYDAIVIGSGLAGLTASLELLGRGLSVALVEKTDKLGGNSAKASSGINGVPTRFQEPGDSVSKFVRDTIKSGKGLSNPELVDILASESSDAIHWLADTFLINLSAVTQLGGHSFARTHRGSGKLPPGFAIVSALTKSLQNAEKVDIITNTLMRRFITSKDGGSVAGIEVEGQYADSEILGKNVILATGGYSADFDASSSLLKRFRPDLLDFPLTNGQQTTGDGQKIAEASLGASLLHMDQVQIHPTGFVQLKDAETANNKWKFLCGELIRGIGGILLSPENGKRFVNEVSTRDEVTKAILGNSDTSLAAIVVSSQDYNKASPHIDFYVSQKVMFKGTVKDLAAKLREAASGVTVSPEELKKGISDYNKCVAAGEDSLGRSHLGDLIGDEFYFGIITPVLHFSMGGIETNPHSQIVTKEGTAFSNAFAVGEVSAGVHGGNRLAGSSLLECVVFGRRVARFIAEHDS